MTGLIDYRTGMRDRFAFELRELRRKARLCGLGGKAANDLARQFVGPYHAPKKPTHANLWAEAREAWEFGTSPIRPHGDCYYSQCGLDDAEGERKDAAREHALAIWREIGRPLP